MRRRLLIGLALAAGLAGHLWFWYRPRLRPVVPDVGSPAVVAVLAADASWGFWVPYPHQNLGVVARSVGDLDGVVAAIARLAGRPAPRSPRFGPFRVPPAREAGAAGSSHGTSAAIELYPSTAAMVRLSGLLAGNPWLAGGAVEGGEAAGTVEWSGGRRWQLNAGDVGAIDPTLAAALPTTPVLALLRSGQPLGILPPGFYGLSESAGGQELVRLDAPARLAGVVPPTAFATADLAALIVERRPDGVAEALALFTAAGPGGLPALATFVQGGGRPSGIAAILPLDKLGRLLGGLPETDAAGWHVEAIDPDTLQRAVGLAGGLPVGGAAPVGVAWLRPTAARQALATVRDWLDGLGPLLPSRLVEGSRDLDVLLAALAPVDRVEAVVEANGGVRVELVD